METIDEGLVLLEMTRHVSMISITLSSKDLNKNSRGFFLLMNDGKISSTSVSRAAKATVQGAAQIQVAEGLYGRGRGGARVRGWSGRGGYGGYGRGGFGGYRNNLGYNQVYGNNLGYNQGYHQGYGNNQGYNQGYQGNKW